MHCTNGIIIQKENETNQSDVASMEENTTPTVKRKFFTPVDTHITPYHQVERVPPENTPEIERNTNIINEYLSKQGDFL